MKQIKIDNNLTIGLGRTSIIAEVGINHNGSFDMAKPMIETAWKMGADLIKLQSFITKKFFTKDLPYYKSTQNLELGFKEVQDLFLFAAKKGIRLFTTPFDMESLNFLDEFDLPAYKIASMDCNNYQLIEAVSKKQKPVILSTGMATENEIEAAVQRIKKTGNQQIILLHCVSDYPTQPENVNLKYLNNLQKKFDIPCGFSDHTVGMDTAILSVGLGACTIEKHFTLDKELKKNFPESDHEVSMDPYDLKELARFCKQAEVIKGTDKKTLTDNEKKGRDCFRRGLYAKSDILEGEKLTDEKLIALRPVRGCSVSELDDILGKTALRILKKDEPINRKDLS